MSILFSFVIVNLLTGHKLPPRMEVFHRIFHMLDTNEKIPTAVLAIGTKKKTCVWDLFQQLTTAIVFKDTHLLYGNLIQLDQSFRTWPHSAHCFLNPVEFEGVKIRIYPHSKFKSDVLMGIGSTIASCFRNYAYSPSFIHPLFST